MICKVCDEPVDDAEEPATVTIQPEQGDCIAWNVHQECARQLMGELSQLTPEG